ncbi:hypothetical protein [Staphylococcus auricularis]|uniref:hypothetical protein n=1 Tax=Staphylococcus auricularis TaxID=29379 RepID=UPI002DBE4B25|nr:hypothetical protein [Staphylococcus auricularis]MEB6570829.1 hypothetical protein [Staphylococcus auricularis]
MKINQRYVKVLVLFSISNLISNTLVKNDNFFKFIVQTLLGYTVFAFGLKYLKKLQSK